jgi:rare lipoprotein A
MSGHEGALLMSSEPDRYSHQRNKGQIMAVNSLAKLALILTLLVSITGAPTGAWAQSGLASIYWGGQTATGEHVRSSGLTAAHRTLPFGTMVQITNRHTGRSVVVRINDRGPFKSGRIIDVTIAAARALGFSVDSGLARVTLAVLSSP